jgi:hypothetical protein
LLGNRNHTLFCMKQHSEVVKYENAQNPFLPAPVEPAVCHETIPGQKTGCVRHALHDRRLSTIRCETAHLLSVSRPGPRLFVLGALGLMATNGDCPAFRAALVAAAVIASGRITLLGAPHGMRSRICGCQLPSASRTQPRSLWPSLLSSFETMSPLSLRERILAPIFVLSSMCCGLLLSLTRITRRVATHGDECLPASN